MIYASQIIITLIHFIGVVIGLLHCLDTIGWASETEITLQQSPNGFLWIKVSTVKTSFGDLGLTCGKHGKITD